MPTAARWAKMTPEEKEQNRLRTLDWQRRNRERMRELNRIAHLKKVGKLSRRSSLEMTDELRKQHYRDKANLRATRAKKARFKDELTQLVVSEAHRLRKLRNELTGIEWHVDHIVPLKGKKVSGLHIWSNFAVIPKGDNLRKGNSHPIHD